MENWCAEEGLKKRKDLADADYTVAHNYFEVLKTIALLRVVDSKTLNLLFTSARVRTAFLKKALERNHVKESQIKERAPSENYRRRSTRYYTITRSGLNFLADDPDDFFSALKSFEGNIPIFDPNEYGQEKRKRLLSFKTAAVAARGAGAEIPLEALTYISGTEKMPDDDLVPAEDTVQTLSKFYGRYLTPEFANQCTFLRELHTEEDSQYMVFHSGQEVKQLVTTASVQGVSRDFSSGKYAGVVDSHFKSLMLFTAPSFTMSWSDWNMRDELTAYGLWARRNRMPDQYQRDRNGSTAALIVDNAREFAYHFHGCQKKTGEAFGGKFRHLYIIPNEKIGVAFLRWIMLMDEQSMQEQLYRDAVTCLGFISNKNQFSGEVFPLCSTAGMQSAAGFILDGKRIQIWYNAATRNPRERFEIICWEWQQDYYRRVLPENVSYYLVPMQESVFA